MHIGIVGGLDRSEVQYAEVAAQFGHTIEVHTGHVVGRAAKALEALVRRSDLVLVRTDINSHAAVWLVRRLSKIAGVPYQILHRSGISRFTMVLRQYPASPKEKLLSAANA